MSAFNFDFFKVAFYVGIFAFFYYFKFLRWVIWWVRMCESESEAW
jgi:hypothetical protein